MCSVVSVRPKNNTTDLFEVPEEPKEVIPEKKVSLVPAKKPAAPATTGTCPWPAASQCLTLGLTLLVRHPNAVLLISFKCLRHTKRSSLKRKCPWCPLKSRKPHLPKVLVSDFRVPQILLLHS